MKNILVPVGNTENGINNLKYAVNFASISGATVYLINIYKEFSKAGGMGKVTQLALEDNEKQLQEVLDQVDTGDVEVIAKPIKGNPFDGIARISKQLGIELIIMSPQSVDIKDEIYLGSLTGKLVKQTDTPILIVPRGYTFKRAETILFAVKHLELDASCSLTSLKGLMEVFSAKLNVLRVITPDVANKKAAQPSGELKELMNDYTETHNATIYQGILERFQQSQADILCVMRRKRGFFQKLFEHNAVYKKDFYTSKPLLILCGDQ